MRYIDQWLSGLGLEYIIPKLKENGITTPKKLAQLTLRDMYEVVGVEDAEDRKKLYYLIQRLQTILNKDQGKGNDSDGEDPPPPSKSAERISAAIPQPAPRIQTRSSQEFRTSPVSTRKTETDYDNSDSVDDDLRSFRRRPTKGVAESVRDDPSDYSEPEPVLSSSRPTTREPKVGSIKVAVSESIETKRPTRRNSVATSGKSGTLSSRDEMDLARRRAPSPDTMAMRRAKSPADSRPLASARSSTRVQSPSPPPAPPVSDFEPIQDMAIRVVVRKRPISKKELDRGEKDVMDIVRGGHVTIHEPKTKVDLTKLIEDQNFVFDDAFQAEETNELIYRRTMKHLVSSLFEGGKASCFAYGQTGSGKTFTMMGSKPSAPAEATVNAGLYVLAARDVFGLLRKPMHCDLQVFVSCFEIYAGKLFDLLNDRAPVKCLENSKQQVLLPGLSEHLVNSVEQLLDMMARAHSLRSTGSTGANMESSRSHMILQILVRGNLVSYGAGKKKIPGAKIMGKLSFIDLAGSERGADTQHNNKQTRMEGAEINTSLLALKEVIRSLEKKAGHTPFRGSKLTQVLKDSFVGDNTRTCMVACVSPSNLNCEHTLNTLRYADRVKEHHGNVRGDSGGGAKQPDGGGQQLLRSDTSRRSASVERRRDPVSIKPLTPVRAVHSDEEDFDDDDDDDERFSVRPSTSLPVTKKLQASSQAAQHPSKLAPPKAAAPQNAVSYTPAPAPAPASKPSNRASLLQDPSKTPTRQQSAEEPPSAASRLRYGIPKAPSADSDRGEGGSLKLKGKIAAPSVTNQDKREAERREAERRFDERLEAGRRADMRQESERVRRQAELAEDARREQALYEAERAEVDRRHAERQERLRREREVASNVSAPTKRTSSDLQRESYDQRVGGGPSGGGGSAMRDSHKSSFEQDMQAFELNKFEGEDFDLLDDTHSEDLVNDVEESDEPVVFGYDEYRQDSNALGRMSSGLFSAHKLAIAEMVEVMKEEMELVQNMEVAEDRDSEAYADALERILAMKAEGVEALRAELDRFSAFRRGEEAN